MADEEKLIGEIHIKITDHNIVWDSELGFQEVYFWLGAAQESMMNTFLTKPEA